MERGRQILFHPFRLDTGNERLWRGSQVVSLRPKSLAVLRYLAEHPGRLIARKELLNAVWLDTHVSNYKAIRFYERNGFKKSGESHFTIGTQTFQYHLMSLAMAVLEPCV